MSILFTKEDQELILERTSRDPLGVMPIWQYRGRSIVPNLTEQTREVRGFQILVSALYLYEEFRAASKENNIEPEQFFMLVEQAFAYSCFKHTADWPLPGKRRVTMFVNSNNVKLSTKGIILDNQLSNGIWGLYRGAAGRSALLHDNVRCLSLGFKGEMKSSGIDDKSKNQLFRDIKNALINGEWDFSLDTRRELPGVLYEMFKSIPHKRILKKYLLPPGSLAERTAELIYENRKIFHDSIAQGNRASYRIFINKCIKHFSEETEKANFRRILLCENFIAPVELIFRYLFKYSGKKLTDAIKDIKISVDLQVLKDALNDFKTSGPYEGYADGRFKLYSQAVDLSSHDALVNSILYCHNEVSQERKREPWIEMEGGKIRSLMDVYPPDVLVVDQKRTWINDYYLEPLLRIYEGLR